MFLVALVAFTPLAEARTSNGIAAVVNDDIITHSELADRLQMIVASSNMPRTRAFKQRIANQVLTGLIAETVQIQEARRLGLTVSDEEIDEGLSRIAGQNNFTLAQFQSVLRRQGVPMNALREQIRAQIAWGKVVQSQLRPRVVITDNDVAAEVSRRTGLMGSKEFKVSEIFLPITEVVGQAELRDTANNLVRQIRNEDASFETLAQQFSASTSASAGGDLGWVAEGTLDPDVELAVTALAGGGISEPIATDDGLTIVKVDGVREAGGNGRIVNPDDVRQELGMKRIDILQRSYLRDLRSAAYVETRIE